MSQLVYNVTVAVSEDIRDEWLDWMREVQIPQALETGLLTSARLMRVHAFERDALTYCVQYLAETRENYETFQREFAPAIDARHQKRFSDGATTFSTVLEVLKNFERATH
jgi:hypothetical protein